MALTCTAGNNFSVRESCDRYFVDFASPCNCTVFGSSSRLARKLHALGKLFDSAYKSRDCWGGASTLSSRAPMSTILRFVTD